MKYFLILALSVAACFGLQSLALHMAGGRTTKSESNFFSSIGRIQTGVSEPTAEVFLLGSSLTGRFPSRSEEFPDIANLGCDGESAVVVMRAIDNGILSLPEVLIIEGNTLYKDQGSGKSLVGGVINSHWFRLGLQIPNIGATARPSAFAYSILLERKVGRSDTGEKEPLPTAAVPIIPSESDLPGLPEEFEILVDELSQIAARLQARGSKILIVQLPPGASPDSPNTRIPYEFSRKAKIPILDLATDLPSGAVTYTDGVHMAPSSAAAALRSILRALETF